LLPGLASAGGFFLIQENTSMTTSVLRAAAKPPAQARAPELGLWGRDLASQFQGLSPVFVSLLALWSCGIILARCCGLSTVSLYWSRLSGQSDNTTRQRLREFYQEAQAKAGAKRGVKRCDFEVSGCFLPLLRWVLSFWSCQRLALALDVTNLGARFQVLCVSVLYGGIGIPVAWKILPGNQGESWHAHWCRLLHCLQPALGADWTVVVLTDRGLESARLFREVVTLGWHPLMRAKAGGKFRPAGWVRWYRLGQLVPQVGCRFTASGLAYKTSPEPLACTLLACWDEGYDEPWLLLTDLPTAAASPSWYAFRAWIEQGFKVIKSGALQWQHTRMTKAERAERLWLAIAVSVLWLVVIGAAVEGDQQQETLREVRTPTRAQAPPRRHRLFVLGLAEWLACWQSGRPWLSRKLTAEPWADVWHNVPTLTEMQFCSEYLYP
jgi:Transposase DDE domain